MRYATMALLGVLVAGLWPIEGSAQEGGSQVSLWERAAPGAVGDSASDRPTITPYLLPATQRPRAAVVVFPGGGYGHLAVDHEGDQVARWLNSLGINAFVVRYRLGPQYHHPAMIQDAQRAIRTVRARAREWGIDPARVGVIGFSAGGHLASTTGTHFDDEIPVLGDEVDRQSARPDFMMLIYPVITMQASYTHRGSRTNLLGEDADPALVWELSNETQVTPRTPPTFLVHTTDDAGVPVENSLRFYRALREAGVPVEMHLFETGRHGFGLAPDNPVLSRWTALAEAWMRSHGWLGEGVG